jgi:FtsH-binding integral membrane protein
MVWQDMIFLMGSLLSVGFLAPTIRDAGACVPRATSIPSMVIGLVYSLTFLSMGMDFSAFGSFAACGMWSLIVYLRAPETDEFELSVLPERVTGRNTGETAE